jgi:3-phosphoshikimate 1-carboxyvinyltransferase
MDGQNIKVIDKFPEGVITPPPSKSISHRALICAALAGGKKAISKVRNIGDSEDIAATRHGMDKLIKYGTISGSPKNDISIGGEFGASSITSDLRVIDCGESGSTLRFLIPLAALDGQEWIFRGVGRLMERPLGVYEDVLGKNGVRFEHRDGEVRVRGPLSPGVFELPGDVSSQFISGLLLALPLLGADSAVRLTTRLESADYVNLTVDVMSAFGVEIADEDSGWRVPGGQAYSAAKYRVESDWSQAAFFLCAGALGRRVTVDGMSPGSLQGDMRILGILKDAGCDVKAEMRMIPQNGNCTVRALAPRGGLNAVTVDASDIPDLVPPVAALACYLKGRTRIENAGRLRLKESDRLAALAGELGRIGADIKIDGDALVINGAPSLAGGSADAFGDHRIAMALAVASIGCKSPVKLSGAQSVSKSYPAFWRDFEKSERYEDVL